MEVEDVEVQDGIQLQFGLLEHQPGQQHPNGTHPLPDGVSHQSDNYLTIDSKNHLSCFPDYCPIICCIIIWRPTPIWPRPTPSWPTPSWPSRPTPNWPSCGGCGTSCGRGGHGGHGPSIGQGHGIMG